MLPLGEGRLSGVSCETRGILGPLGGDTLRNHPNELFALSALSILLAVAVSRDTTRNFRAAVGKVEAGWYRESNCSAVSPKKASFSLTLSIGVDFSTLLK